MPLQAVGLSEVETVALWTGLFAGIASIVLAVVAISFSVLVDKRSRDVSNLTIQSLQRIDSTVERISGDTAGLIRAAWDKLLGTVNLPGNPVIDDDARQRL